MTANNRPASVAGGECQIIEAPGFVVKGQRRIDQRWIDQAVEAGIAACGWSRPKAEKVVASVAARSKGK